MDRDFRIAEYVPPGRLGVWAVERFQVSDADAKWAALRAGIAGGGFGRGALPVGEYTSLRRGGELVMSDTPDELQDLWDVEREAHGHCLVAGLGLGCVAVKLALKPRVSRVTVIEVAPEVVALVGQPLLARFADKLEIVTADIFAWQPQRGVRYGAAWFDIWDNICGDNLPSMQKLRRRFARRANWKGCWCEELLR
ncbi:MAG: class I SAM-dependent methyltransferase [Elusimicrobia bacterium]|nr:class I SAM-dependent methyltransferase [Elusimicrobiota bacterium]